MANINGTLLLVYADSTLIAAQKNLTFTVNQNLFDTTSKDSGGWAEHGNGMRSFEVSIEALASTTGLSAEGLKDYIISRKSLLLLIDGMGTPYVAKCDVASSTITGPLEDATTLSGTLRGNGAVYDLTGDNAELFTDFDNVDYDTFTEALTIISSAVNAAGAASARSDAFSITSGDVIKVFTFLTLISGELPSVALINAAGTEISNSEQLAAGANFITLTATDTDAAGMLEISNTATSNFATTHIYCFKA